MHDVISAVEVSGVRTGIDAPEDGTPAERRWAFPALIALLVVTATCWTVRLGSNGWANSFYSAAVQAGTKSWKAFLFGSSDAASSITVDKPPASLWVMEISGRLFGLNSWSLQLPQVLLGVASVAMLYVAVKRPFGPTAGLIAGAVLALTPVATLMFRYNNPDALLVFLMVAAVWAMLRAVEDGRTRWIVLSGALLGLGFLTKQLQVLLITPGLVLTYLVAGPPRAKVRVLQLGSGLAAMVVAAGWWVALVQLWPKADRPYIGGSSDNSFLDLTFGYNGFGRILGGSSSALPTPPGGFGGAGHPPGFGSPGVARMFSTVSGTQISWLLPAALIFLVAGLVLCGRAHRKDARRASYLAWGGWLVSTALVFSFMSGLFHDYYTVALSPAVAALIGIGCVQLWQRRQSAWVTATLAVTVILTAVWAWVLLGRTAQFVPPLRWCILAVGAVAAVGLILPRVRPGVQRAAAGLAVIAALAGPVAYCVQTVSTAHSGPIVTAGPATQGGPPGMPGPLSGLPGPPGAAGGRFPSGPPGTAKVSDAVAKMLAANADRYTWVAAARGSMDSAGYQLATGDPVMPLGGFAGFDPSPTLAQFQQYVRDGRIHYYIQSSFPGPPGAPSGMTGATPGNGEAPGQTHAEADSIGDWVKAHYTATTVDGVTLYDLTQPAH